MDVNDLMKDIYDIVRRLDDIKIFNHVFPFNNTEMQMIREIIRAQEEGTGIISSRLAKKLGITRSAVSQTVNKLEERNVVRRVPDKVDKKIAYIELSENSRGVYEQIKLQVEEILGEVIKNMGEDKVSDFITVSKEFVDSFDQAIRNFREAQNNR